MEILISSTGIGLRIQLARELLGLTQENAARAMGVSRTTLGNWEMERTTPSSKDLPIISEALRCDITWVVTGLEPKEKNRIEYDEDADYPSFSEWLTDEDLQDLCNPSEEEIAELRGVRFKSRLPDKRGWTELLTSLRRARKKRED